MPDYFAHASAGEWGSISVDMGLGIITGGGGAARTVVQMGSRVSRRLVGRMSRIVFGAGRGKTFNLDTSVIRSLVQGSPVNRTVRRIRRDIRGADLVVTETALTELQPFMQRVNFSWLQERQLKKLRSRLTQIPDNPSQRFQIPHSNRLGKNDLVIFGTGDNLGLTTLTQDATFVRAFENRFSTTIDVVLYPAVRF